MERNLFLFLFVLAIALSIASMRAEARNEERGRYSMTKTEDGYLRLDRNTGAVSICRRGEGRKWSCLRVEDDYDDRQDDIAELRKENRKLRAKLHELEALAKTLEEDVKRRNLDPLPQMPNKEEVDKAMTFLEHMLRRFKDMVERLNEPAEPSTPL